MSAGMMPRTTKTEPWELIQAFAQAMDQATAQNKDIQSRQQLQALKAQQDAAHQERAAQLGLSSLAAQLAMKEPYEQRAAEREQQFANQKQEKAGEIARQNYGYQAEVSTQKHKEEKAFDADLDIGFAGRRREEAVKDAQAAAGVKRGEGDYTRNQEFEDFQRRNQITRGQQLEDRASTNKQQERLLALGTDERVRQETLLDPIIEARDTRRAQAIEDRQSRLVQEKADVSKDLDAGRAATRMAIQEARNRGTLDAVHARAAARGTAELAPGLILHDPEKFVEEGALDLKNPAKFRKLYDYSDPKRPGKNFEVYEQLGPRGDPRAAPPGSTSGPAPTAPTVPNPAAPGPAVPTPPTGTSGVDYGTRPAEPGPAWVDPTPAPAPAAPKGTGPAPVTTPKSDARLPKSSEAAPDQYQTPLEQLRRQIAEGGGNIEYASMQAPAGRAATAVSKDTDEESLGLSRPEGMATPRGPAVTDPGSPVTRGGRVPSEGSRAYWKKSVTEMPAKYQGMVLREAQKYDLPPNLLASLLHQESGWREVARSPAGAQGIAQFIPGTAKRFGVDVTDPASSIRGAAEYMRANLDKFKGNVGLALAGYNWGEGRVAKAIAQGRTDFGPGETRKYVQMITGQPLSWWANRAVHPNQRAPEQQPTKGDAGRDYVDPPRRWEDPPNREWTDPKYEGGGGTTTVPKNSQAPEAPPIRGARSNPDGSPNYGGADPGAGVLPDLADVLKLAQKYTDVPFHLHEGLRDQERQAEMVKRGWSKTMNSNHLGGRAVDIRAEGDPAVGALDSVKYARINQAVQRAAKELGVPIKWGGTFKGFRDLPHFEVPRDYTPRPRQEEQQQRPRVQRTDHPDLFYVDV